MALVTGTTGLLGSHLAYKLLENGEEVYSIKRSTSDTSIVEKCFQLYSNNSKELFDKIHWIEGDILDFYFLDELISKHKQVYHTAAFVSFHKADHTKIMDINVQGTINIIESCKKHNCRLVYASSIAALGRGLGDVYTTENDFRDSSFKSSVYSNSKFLAEQEVWRAIAEGLNAVMVNPAVIIGPGDWLKSSAQLFTTVNNGLKFYTNGSNGYVDVRDVADIMFRLMQTEINGERFILSSENISYKKLFQDIANALSVAPPNILANKFVSELSWRAIAVWAFISGKTPLITKETAKSANTYYKYSSQKIINALNYKFISIEESIKHTAKAYLKDLNKS